MYYDKGKNMSHRNEDPAPKIVTGVSDMGWFESVLNSSRETLAATPEDGKPSWYRQYEAEEAAANSHS